METKLPATHPHELPDLGTGQEFREHTRRSILHPRYEDLKRMERLLDEYRTALHEYRKCCKDLDAAEIETLNRLLLKVFNNL